MTIAAGRPGPLPLTPSQTAGPYLHLGLRWADDGQVVPEGAPGAFRLHGALTDANGDPVPDGVVEIWQADAEGRYPHPEDPQGREVDPTFRGFGRSRTDAEGRFAFVTVKPGRVAGPNGTRQAPHLAVSVFARGVSRRIATRIYFGDEAAANGEDLVLGLVPPADADRLLARPDDEGYRFDVRLGGELETPIFEV